MSNNTEQPTPKEEETHKVFVGNLSFTSTEETLKDFFKDSGEVLESIIIKKGQRPKGYGFVAFRTLEEAEKAVQNCDKKELDGREVSVQVANQREPRTSAEKKKKKRKTKKPTKPVSEQGNESSNEESAKENQVVEEGKPKTSVFVANLPLDITMMDLTELFKDYQVESALVAIQRSGRSKGYGFVELTTVEEMNKVLKEFVDIEVQGRAIHISAATSEKTNIKKPKSTKKTEEEPAAAPTTPKKKSSRNRKSKKNKEGIFAAKDAQEAVRVAKEDDGISAANDAQEAVRVAKEDDGVNAAKEAKEAVGVAKEDDGVSAAKEAKEAVRVAKEDDGAKSAKAATESQTK
ncbi:hypothetical protein HPULCUR_002889 [Helicostylum pulchrum]|uniref:RRM domain-containing protein n=1 Tax=Helicostylum pulchrum TaxID=562976 RepID=A0ABP9XS04_9FUNG